MPRYYFDIRDKLGTVQDDEGLDFESLELAILEARKALHEMGESETSVDNSAISIDIREGDKSLVTVVASTSVVPSLPLKS